MKILEPMWSNKTETASRLRGRIESVLDWATVRGYRSGDNPARRKGHLDHLLPARAKVQKVEHHAALAYADIGAFMAKVREQDGSSALALEFCILTAARTSEVLNPTWAEFDLGAEMWTIPAERMKAGREHRVPLSTQAVTLIRKLADAKRGAFVFPGQKEKKPLSNMALAMTLRRMERAELTVHGFRSTFRDWAAERTNYPREVCEHALAHQLPDKVEAAYQRGDLFGKRSKLMQAWADFCDKTEVAGEVVSLRA